MIFSLAWLGQGALSAQEPDTPIVESSSALVRGVPIEYFEFGDSGLPVVWIQDHHDMFRASTFGRESVELWASFLRRFSDSFQVIAPVRRGWGASGDPGYGFDVATQAEDVLGLLDVMGIDKAVFVGRTFATQDVMWIVEHHPERALGAVFIGTPFIRGTDKFVAATTPALTQWETMHNRAACDVGVGREVDRRLSPRNSYRPHFFHDRDMRIDVPALAYLYPQAGQGLNSRRLDWVMSGRLGGDEECDPEARAYFAALRSDSVLFEELRATFAGEADVIADVREALREAFGERITMFWAEGMGVESWYAPIRAFLDGLTAR